MEISLASHALSCGQRIQFLFYCFCLNNICTFESVFWLHWKAVCLINWWLTWWNYIFPAIGFKVLWFNSYILNKQSFTKFWKRSRLKIWVWNKSKQVTSNGQILQFKCIFSSISSVCFSSDLVLSARFFCEDYDFWAQTTFYSLRDCFWPSFFPTIHHQDVCQKEKRQASHFAIQWLHNRPFKNTRFVTEIIYTNVRLKCFVIYPMCNSETM